VIDGNHDAIVDHITNGRFSADDVLQVVGAAAERGFIEARRESALTDAALDARNERPAMDGEPQEVVSSIDVRDVPLNDVYTDEERFQPRGGAFSEETARRIVDDYDPSLMDPIDVWPDPEQDGRLYVLAGHSRLEGFRRRGADTIPAVVKSDMTEQQAIRYALVENDKGTNLTNAERAGVVRRMREAGEFDTMKAQRKFAQNLYDRNAKVVFDLSWLSPQGKSLDVLTRLEGAQGTDYREAETMAQWVGKLMRLHRDDFTRQHEDEMFNYLLDNYKDQGRGFSAFPGFRQYVEEAKNRAGPMGSFSSDDRLNLKQVRPQSQQERAIDRQVEEARQEVRDAKERLDDRREELLARMAKEDEVTREDVQRALDPLEERVQAAQQELIQARREADQARSTVSKSQRSLMDAMRENPSALAYIGRCRQLTTRDGLSYRGDGDFMFTSPGMDMLLIVPGDRVRERTEIVDDEGAEAAYEEWHHFDSDDTDFQFRLDLSEAEPVGVAKRIRYYSDKVMRPGDKPDNEHSYYHDFTDDHTVYEAHQGDGLVALLIGAEVGNGTLQPHGTLEIDRRGILN
jgi:hypothetical protein